ncbi:MAG: glycerate kinase [Bacteroidia bacterium]|nr:glycerate kinase [Bacteroidia bacterium]
MIILIASDSFKDACSSVEACHSIAKGIRKFDESAHCTVCPISDGGEGAVEVLHYHLGGRLVQVPVFGPLFKQRIAQYLIVNERIAIIEMASASGLELLKSHERNPMNTSTFGTGELIKSALNEGCAEILLTLGGSATNDMGIGMASALGYQFFDDMENPVVPIGANLNNIIRIEDNHVDPRIYNTDFGVLSDVNHPLFGKAGAAFTFGSQKGASESDVDFLDKGLQHMAMLIKNTRGLHIADTPGSGAAGGMGGGCIVFLNARMTSGIDQMFRLIDFDKKIENADLILTGEGHLDSQTLGGKVIRGIVEKAGTHNIPVHAFCGKSSLSHDEARDMGLKKVWVINKNESTDDIAQMLLNTKKNLQNTAFELAKVL